MDEDSYYREHKIYQMLRTHTKARIFMFLYKTFIDEKRKFITTEQIMRVFKLKSINYTWNLLKQFCDLQLLEKVKQGDGRFRSFIPKNLEEYSHYVGQAKFALTVKEKKNPKK